jgi:hypothetical protein
MTANEQASLWDVVRQAREHKIQKRNHIGPFKFVVADTTHRFFDCANYNCCLSHAAKHLWKNFTCYGCLKTAGKRIK